MVTSDFRPEVEIRPFRARLMQPVMIMNTFIHQSVVDKRQRNYVKLTIKYKLSKQAQ